MGLSSEDVVNWQLKTGMRGYLIPQVDELLDEVADELDRLVLRIQELEAEREAVRSSLDDQFEVEETLRRTLYQAQRAADQTIEDAKAEAARIIAAANEQSAAIISKAQTESGELSAKAIREATRERASVRAQLEAEEARMRARRQELRKEIDRLSVIEVETRRLLSGLYEDRLQELEAPSFDLSGIELPPESHVVDDSEAELAAAAAAAGDDETDAVATPASPRASASPVPAPPLMDSEDSPSTARRRAAVRSRDGVPMAFADAGHASAAPLASPVSAAADLDASEDSISEPSIDETQLDAEDTPTADVDAEVDDERDVSVVEVDDGSDAVAAVDEEGDVEPESVENVVPDDTDEDVIDADTDTEPTRPAYLAAVDQAVATINANDEADGRAPEELLDGEEFEDEDAGPTGAVDADSEDSSDEDLVEDLVDEVDEAAGGGMTRPDNLFDDAPRRRRRRSV